MCDCIFQRESSPASCVGKLYVPVWLHMQPISFDLNSNAKTIKWISGSFTLRCGVMTKYEHVREAWVKRKDTSTCHWLGQALGIHRPKTVMVAPLRSHSQINRFLVSAITVFYLACSLEYSSASSFPDPADIDHLRWRLWIHRWAPALS